MTEKQILDTDREMLCANCARPVAPTQADKVWAADKFGFMDDPPFCSQVCADIWHRAHLDISDNYNYGEGD
jgi:hypothetical protein